MLVLPVPENLNKLLQNCRLTAIAPLRELRRIMVMAVDLSIVLVITVLRSKYCRANRAHKMVDVVFIIQGRNI
jgi:hypothetical protein